MGTFCLFPNERKIAPPFYELFYPFLSPRLIVNQISNYKHVSVQKVPSSPGSKKYQYFIFLFHYPKISNYMQVGGGGEHYLEEKIGTFSIAFLKVLAPFSFLLHYKIAE